MGRHKSLGLFPVHYPGIRSHPGRHQRGHRRGDVTRCFHAESARQCGNKPAAVAVAAAGGIHRLDRPRRNMLRPAIAADKPEPFSPSFRMQVPTPSARKKWPMASGCVSPERKAASSSEGMK